MINKLDTNTLDILQARYQKFLSQNLQLNMSRGKPSSEQLDLSDALLNNITEQEVTREIDYRNYSTPDLLTGLPQAKKLFADMLAIKDNQVIIGGNSSLNLMYDTIVKMILHPLPHQKQNWATQGKIKFLCPTPGYDRHFSICESLNIEMISVPLTGSGPDMEQVERLVQSDPTIKGIWCVPKYSNPTGECYSDATIQRLAKMKTATPDFKIMWDNAYAVHDLDMNNQAKISDILLACDQAGNASRPFMFCSTSKITYPGGGLAMIAANEENISWLCSHLKSQTIGYDKINQLRHLKLLPNKQALLDHMANHAAILKQKFEVVDTVLTNELGNQGAFATWTKPSGGYFISFTSQPYLAKKIIKMAHEAGVTLTNAGATYPYKNDPLDSNIRIAPSLPSLVDLQKATEVLAVVIKIVTLSQLKTI